jgi:4-hydroxy-tetrahydrodipicolinate synthase
MTEHSWPRGLFTALVTPLRDDSIDHAAFEAVIEYQIAHGAAGLVVTGGTGEHGALNFEERIRLVRDAVAMARGRVAVIAATGCLATRDTIRLSCEAQTAGVTGLLVASPFGEPISWSERRAFYADLDAAVATPIMIYNTPPAGLLEFEQIRQLAELRNVTAVKDSSGSPELMGDLLAWKESAGFRVYVGMDSYLFEAVGCGADGAVFGAANFLTAELSALIDQLHQSGPGPQTLSSWRQLRPLLRQMEQSNNYVGMCKAGLRLRGIDAGNVRKPYLMPDADEIENLRVNLDRLAPCRTA